MSANQPLLSEANTGGLWFRARKSAAIWARRLEQREDVATLEGIQAAAAGTWLCRGAGGEVWPQPEQGLLTKYRATTEVDEMGWRRYEPRPETSTVLAARIDHSFSVQSPGGVLGGKAGDYLVKSLQDLNVPLPRDLWVVDQRLFAMTYVRVNDSDPDLEGAS